MVSNTEFQLLAALARDGAKEQYGLQLIDSVKDMTGGSRTIPVGTVHTTLKRLERKHLVRGRWGSDDEVRRGARRRYYEITASGLRYLADVRSMLHGTAEALA